MNKQKTFLSTVFLLMGIILMITTGCKKKTDPVPVPSTVTDVDGNVYHKVTIGTQVWLVENLRTTKYRNGDAIPNVTVDSIWNKQAATATGAWCDYNNDGANILVYGHLYNWFAVNDPRGLAPAGYHVATQTEWETLTTYLGGDSLAGGKLKETGTAHWLAPNTGATNSTGFTAVPGGFRMYSGKSEMIGTFGVWWTSTLSDEFSAMNCGMFSDNAGAIISVNRKANGCSVRCIKD
ncbi:MAG: fibrobacter succinogenes major paralogous domain-containing protein [Bacteroidota bacterium]